MNSPTQTAESVSAIANLAQQGSAVKRPANADEWPFVILGPGQTLQTVPISDQPRRPQGIVALHDGRSFCAYVNAYWNPSSVVYATMPRPDQKKGPCFVAVLNDHRGGRFVRPGELSATGEAGGEPIGGGWRDWKATLDVHLSRELMTWFGKSGEQMSQTAFATFLEDNAVDVVQPDGATLLEMILQFEATKSATFKSVRRLNDGSVTFQWVEENNAAGDIRIPTVFKLRMPVFEFEKDVYEVDARLRWRLLGDGKLSIWYDLVRPHKVLKGAMEDFLALIESGLGRNILLGTP